MLFIDLCRVLTFTGLHAYLSDLSSFIILMPIATQAAKTTNLISSCWKVPKKKYPIPASSIATPITLLAILSRFQACLHFSIFLNSM